jgi:hypothetical protein
LDGDRFVRAGGLDGAVERIDRLGQCARAAACRFHRPQPEQDAQLGVDVEVRAGGGCELPRGRDLRLVLRVVALLEREDRQTGRDQRRHREHAHERTKPAEGASLESSLACLARLLSDPLCLSRRDAGGEVLALEPRLGETRLGRPRFESAELAAPHKQAGVAVDVSPFPRGGREPLMGAQVVPGGIDPGFEPHPLAEQRLVRHFDRRLLRARIPVEGEQPGGAERVEGEGELPLVDVERVEVPALDAASRVRGLAQRHEAEEELAHRLSPVRVEALVERLGPPCDRPGDTTDLVVGRTRKRRPHPPLVELGERVLEQRQRARLVDDVGDDAAEQSLLERHAHALGGSSDRALELVRRQRQHRLNSVPHQFADAAMEKRPVVEIRPERDHNPEPTVRVADRHLEAGEKMRAPLIVLHEGECLLELVDDEQKLRTVVGKNALDGPEQTELVRRQLLTQRGGRVYRDPQKRGLEFLEGICARRRHGDLPTAGPNRRHEPGEHHGRLPAPARPDDGEEAAVSHPLDQIRDQLLAPEEVLGVGLQERVEPLVRVADLRGRRRGRVALERRILAEDPARELTELRRRLDAELVDQQATAFVVEADGLCLPASPVERKHQLCAKLLAQRVCGDELFELADKRPVPAEPQVGVDPPLERSQPELLQAADRGLGKRVVGEIRERRPSPQCERSPQVLGSRTNVTVLDFVRGGFEHALEAQRVEGVGLDVEDVPG